ADPAVHGAAAGGDHAAVGGGHERPVLSRRCAGAGLRLPLARLAPAGSAGRLLPDARLQLLRGLPDGAVRLPADRPLAAAVPAAGAAARAAAGGLRATPAAPARRRRRGWPG